MYPIVLGLIACILLSYKFKNKVPDVILINKPTGKIYLRRWWLIPRNKFGFNIYLHHFLSSDEDRALHDHPWWNISILLWGSYLEHMPKDYNKWINDNDRTEIIVKRYPLVPVYRGANAIHRIELINEKPVWTLFITGPVVQQWGFWCTNFWRSHEEFLDITGTTKGKGCD
jgi:hypothetical protein